MGGINHQPCGAYLVQSTRLSRELSIARAYFEFANVALEDLILSELAEGYGNTKEITERLDLSIQALEKSSLLTVELGVKLDSNSFVDLPTLRQLNLEAIGSNFMDLGITNFEVWQEAVRIMDSGGFRAMLEKFRESISHLRQKTIQLHQEVNDLYAEVDAGEMNRVLEENRPGNIRPTFAALYTAWGRFNTLFLASSLISTEVWYAYCGYPSMIAKKISIRVA